MGIHDRGSVPFKCPKCGKETDITIVGVHQQEDHTTASLSPFAILVVSILMLVGVSALFVLFWSIFEDLP